MAICQQQIVAMPKRGSRGNKALIPFKQCANGTCPRGATEYYDPYCSYSCQYSVEGEAEDEDEVCKYGTCRKKARIWYEGCCSETHFHKWCKDAGNPHIEEVPEEVPWQICARRVCYKKAMPGSFEVYQGCCSWSCSLLFRLDILRACGVEQQCQRCGVEAANGAALAAHINAAHGLDDYEPFLPRLR